MQLTTARATIRCLERDLEKAQGDVLVLKVDIEARKELCDKLDAEKVKLNAELSEVNDMRKKVTFSSDLRHY